VKPKQKIYATDEVNQARTIEGCHVGICPTEWTLSGISEYRNVRLLIKGPTALNEAERGKE